MAQSCTNCNLVATSVPNINIHISKMLKNKELKVDSVVKQYLTTASDGQQILKHHTSAFTNKLSKFALAC